MAQLGSTVTNLADFLLARYAELDPDDVHDRGCDVNSYVPFPCNCGVPDRMRAECEAKRRIVEWHDETDDCCEQRTGPLRFVTDPAEAKTVIGVDGSTGRLIGHQPIYGCVTMMMLALPYADHPDYRVEWKP